MRASRLIALSMACTLAACSGDDPVAPVAGVQPWAACVPVADYWPTGAWRSTCPAALGLDTARLRDAARSLDTMPAVRSLVVARHGWIALEAYYHGATSATSFELRSVTKLLTATLVGAAVQDGSLDALSHPLRDYWPQVIDGDPDPRKRALTVDHLLDLTAGFPLAYSAVDTSTYPAPAPLLSRALAADPGARWVYDEPLYHLLSLALRIETGASAIELARRRVFGPMHVAMSARRWSTDDAGNPLGYTGASLTARELLKVGELYRRGGVWNGTRVLPAGWTEYVTTRPPGLAPDSVLWRRGWRQVVWNGRLVDVAIGYGGQYLFWVPSLDLLVAATCDPRAPRLTFWPPVDEVVLEEVVGAVE